MPLKTTPEIFVWERKSNTMPAGATLHLDRSDAENIAIMDITGTMGCEVSEIRTLRRDDETHFHGPSNRRQMVVIVRKRPVW